jgi:hypothetical protein
MYGNTVRFQRHQIDILFDETVRLLRKGFTFKIQEKAKLSES